MLLKNAVCSNKSFKCDHTFSWHFWCWTFSSQFYYTLDFLLSSFFNLFIEFAWSTRFAFSVQSWWLIKNSTFRLFSQMLQTSWFQSSLLQLAWGSTFPSLHHLITQQTGKHRESGEGGKGEIACFTVRNSECIALWPAFI